MQARVSPLLGGPILLLLWISGKIVGCRLGFPRGFLFLPPRLRLSYSECVTAELNDGTAKSAMTTMMMKVTSLLMGDLSTPKRRTPFLSLLPC